MPRAKTEGARTPRTARTAPAEDGPRTAYTTFVVFPDQLLALKQVAALLQAQRGGKADSSAVLRDTLDAIATGGELPEGLKKALAAGVRERRRN
jgi:hypothetical protein